MKKLFLYLLLVGLFAFGNASTSVASFCQDSGDVVFVQLKQGTSFSFTLPEKYLLANGSLALPLEIKVMQDGKTWHSQISEDKTILLPELDIPTGTYSIVFSIGEYTEAKKLTW